MPQLRCEVPRFKARSFTGDLITVQVPHKLKRWLPLPALPAGAYIIILHSIIALFHL